MKKINGTQLIGGIWNSEKKSFFQAHSPINNHKLPEPFYEATPLEVDDACKVAEEAFSVYAQKSGRERALFLEAIAEELEQLGDSLLQRANLETGLPLARLISERGRTVNQLRFFAAIVQKGDWINAIVDKPDPKREPLPSPDLRQMQVPLGPVAVFGASNFPLAFSVAGGDTASALAAGCPVIFKGHPAHPGTCEMVAAVIAKAAHKTNMPLGVFSLLQGASHAVGSILVKHPAIAAVAFTGSFAGGKALYDLAVRRQVPIPVYAEMGSINPVFFLPERIAEEPEALAIQFASSVTLGCGQFCTNPGFFVLQQSAEAQVFLATLRKHLEQTEVHNMLTPTIQSNYLQAIARLKKLYLPSQEEIMPNRVFPQLFTVGFEEGIQHFDTITEEIFGPSTVGLIVENKAQMLLVAQQLKGQLTATLHGASSEWAAYKDLVLLLRQKAGRLVFNGFPTGVEVAAAMVHGGPYPATTDSRTTSVGGQAIYRFTRPVCFQNCPTELLPQELIK